MFAYNWLKSMANVGQYSIHGASGIDSICSIHLNVGKNNMQKLIPSREMSRIPQQGIFESITLSLLRWDILVPWRVWQIASQWIVKWIYGTFLKHVKMTYPLLQVFGNPLTLYIYINFPEITKISLTFHHQFAFFLSCEVAIQFDQID